MNRQQEREMYAMLCELIDALEDPASRNQMQRDDLVSRCKRLRGLAKGWLAKPHALQAQRDALMAACVTLVGLSGTACVCQRGNIGTRPCPVCLSEMAGLDAIAKAQEVHP